MKRLFNKTFFKFVAGFVGIITLAVFSVLFISAYEFQQESKTIVDTSSILPTP